MIHLLVWVKAPLLLELLYNLVYFRTNYFEIFTCLTQFLFRYLDDVANSGDTVHLAECQRITETGSLTPCHLLLTSTHLTTLVPSSSQDDKVFI